MQIAQSLQLSLGKINELPTSLLTRLVVGQQLQAVVMTPATIAELAKVKIEDSILQIRTPVPLAKGQTVMLELVQEQPTDKPVLKLILPSIPDKITETGKQPLVDTAQNVRETVTQKLSSAPTSSPLSIQLKPGQLLQAAVTQVDAAKQIVVVQPQVFNATTKQNKLTDTPVETNNRTIQPKLPPIEIDISALNTRFKAGQRVNIEVVSNQPLAVRIMSPDTYPLQHVVKQQQTSLLSQVDSAEAPMTLKQVSRTLRQVEQLPVPVKQSLQHLLQQVTEKSVIQQPAQLHQAIKQSGVFLESHLRNQPEVVNQDFKANLLKLAQAIETVINKNTAQVDLVKNAHIQSLPSEIRTALLRLVETPEALNQLPAQISANLQQSGTVPSTLLNTLLSLLGRQFDNSPENLKNLAQTLATQTGTNTNSSSASSNTQQPVQNDLQQLKNLLREVQSTAAKVQLNQLSMVRQPDTQGTATVWLIDVPIRDRQQIDMMQLRIEQQHGQKRSQQYSDDTWQVQLNLETHALGPLQAGINLYADTVKVVINAAWQESASLLEQHMEQLQQRLSGLGLNVNQLSCHCVPIKPITPLSTANAQSSSGAWVDLSV